MAWATFADDVSDTVSRARAFGCGPIRHEVAKIVLHVPTAVTLPETTKLILKKDEVFSGRLCVKAVANEKSGR